MAEETNTESELGIIQIESKNLTNIDNFLKGDTNIKIIDCPFPNVTSAVSAFENCTNLESFNGNNVIELYKDNESDNANLDSLQYGNHMFYGCEKLETFTGDLPSLSNGNNMFYYTSISEFTTDLPSLTDGGEMFRECANLKTFKSNLKSLSTYTEMFMDTNLNTFDGGNIGIRDTGLDFITNSHLKDSKNTLTSFKGNLTNSTNTDEMFVGFNKLDTFEGDMNEVTSSKMMFKNCEQLKTFKSNNLEDLSDSTEMFYGCYNLCEFNVPLPSLSNGNNMFYYTSISEFTTDLPSLTDGTGMFRECNNLKTFKSNLESLSTYTYMFVHTNLNTFDGGTINISDTGSRFIGNSCLSYSKDTLTSFKGNFPNINDTTEMFQGYTELLSMTGSMDSVTDATNMFGCIRKKDENGDYIRDENGNFIIISQCENLEQLNCSMNSLQKGNHMFRDCPKLNENNTELGFFYRTLADGLCMFLGTSFTSIPLDWKFPNLTRSKQMFSHTNISGHLSLDMTTQFPEVSTNNGQWSDPASYMFSHCPITSIDFNVSSLDNGICMFAHCTQLTQCTGAKFLEGGSYQNMFAESKFDYGSAYFIKQKAKESNVKKLHIGIGFQLTEDHDFTKENSLIKFPEDNSGSQWCEGYEYCHCHNTNEAAALEYFNKHGMTYHCRRSSATTHYLAFPSIMFVCNPN